MVPLSGREAAFNRDPDGSRSFVKDSQLERAACEPGRIDHGEMASALSGKGHHQSRGAARGLSFASLKAPGQKPSPFASFISRVSGRGDDRLASHVVRVWTRSVVKSGAMGC